MDQPCLAGLPWLHPDVRAQREAEELEGVPSVYELNAAYQVIRKLL